jgi:hypothetical protein
MKREEGFAGPACGSLSDNVDAGRKNGCLRKNVGRKVRRRGQTARTILRPLSP